MTSPHHDTGIHDHDQPFDQSLYDAVMADKMDHALGVPSLATEYSDGYDSGYHHAALTAARLSAERQQVPVIPEGWRLYMIVLTIDGAYRATLVQTHRAGMREAIGDTPNDALNAAINAAKENDHE